MLKIIEGKDSQIIPVTINGQSIVLEAGDIIYSDSIVLPDHEETAISYRAKSNGIPNISIFMEECHCEPKDNEADDRCVVAEGGKAIVDGMIDQKQHHCLIYPLPLKVFRFRIEEHSTTAPGTEVEIILSCK